MTEPVHAANPDPAKLADDHDDLGWDVDRHGHMADHATGPDEEPATVPYEPGGDES